MRVVMRDGIITTYHFDNHDDDLDDNDLGLIDEEDLEAYRKKKQEEQEKYASDKYFDVPPIGIRV